MLGVKLVASVYIVFTRIYRAWKFNEMASGIRTSENVSHPVETPFQVLCILSV